MLPTLVSTNLAKGAVSLSKKKIIIKRLSSIQNFGAMDILCTDKTGTLTEDEIVLETYLNVSGEEYLRVLKHGYLNSSYQTGLKNLLDLAVINYGNKKGFKKIDQDYTKVDEIPFDFKRRRMSVVVESKDHRRQLITKGALEEMLSICSLVEIGDEIVPITDETQFSVKDESEMTLIGYMGFLDPAKESADIILLEKDLNVLEASAFLPFLPMLPIQLLMQNLLYSISQISIP